MPLRSKGSKFSLAYFDLNVYLNSSEADPVKLFITQFSDFRRYACVFVACTKKFVEDKMTKLNFKKTEKFFVREENKFYRIGFWTGQINILTSTLFYKNEQGSQFHWKL